MYKYIALAAVAGSALAVAPQQHHHLSPSIVAPEVCEGDGHVQAVGMAEDYSAYAVTCSDGVIKFVAKGK